MSKVRNCVYFGCKEKFTINTRRIYCGNVYSKTGHAWIRRQERNKKDWIKHFKLHKKEVIERNKNFIINKGGRKKYDKTRTKRII